jgi:hypothetical protein
MNLSIEDPHLAVDASGNAAIVWVEGVVNLTPAMKESIYRPGTGWSAPSSLANLDPAILNSNLWPVTAVGANRSGVLYSVWGLDQN